MNNTLKKNRYARIRKLSAFMALLGTVFFMCTPSQAASKTAVRTLLNGEERLMSARLMRQVYPPRPYKRSIHTGIESSPLVSQSLKPNKLPGTSRMGVPFNSLGTPTMRVPNGSSRAYSSKKADEPANLDISSFLGKMQQMEDKLSAVTADQINLRKRVAELEAEKKPKIVNIHILDHAKNLGMPSQATVGSVGFDLMATDDITVEPGETAFIRTGFCMQLPEDLFAFITSRSGLARNYKVRTYIPSIIDSDYRGEILINLINEGPKPLTINRGMRIAQMLILEFPKIILQSVQSLLPTGRGNGGFGSTGYGAIESGSGSTGSGSAG